MHFSKSKIAFAGVLFLSASLFSIQLSLYQGERLPNDKIGNVSLSVANFTVKLVSINETSIDELCREYGQKKSQHDVIDGISLLPGRHKITVSVSQEINNNTANRFTCSFDTKIIAGHKYELRFIPYFTDYSDFEELKGVMRLDVFPGFFCIIGLDGEDYFRDKDHDREISGFIDRLKSLSGNYVAAKNALEKIIDIQYIDEWTRALSLSQRSEQEFLINLATRNKSPDIRRHAIVVFNEQSIDRIAEIIRDDIDLQVCWTGINRLEKQADIAIIARTHRFPEIRIRAAEKLDDQALAQAVFAEFSLLGKTGFIRREAVKNLTDPHLTSEVIQNEKDDDTRLEALRTPVSPDQKVLAEIIRNEKDDDIQRAALNRMFDQEALIEIAKTNQNHFCRILSVQKIIDQSVLAEIIRNDQNKYVRENAIDSLNDKSILADIALNDKDESIKNSARERINSLAAIETVENLSDQKKLVEIGWSRSGPWSVNIAAVKRITNPEALSHFAAGEIADVVRAAAIQNPNFTDRKVLAEIIENNRKNQLSAIAFEKKNELELLSEVGKNREEQLSIEGLSLSDLLNVAKMSSRYYARVEAVRRIKDQALLADLAKNAIYPEVRKGAVMNPNMTDQKTIADVATSDKDCFVRRMAVGVLADQKALDNIAKKDPSGVVRLKAVERLNDRALAQLILIDIAKADPSEDIRRLAMDRIADQVALTEMAKSEKNDMARLVLAHKLTDSVLAQSIIVDIVKGNVSKLEDYESGLVFYAALESPFFTDQSLLAHIAKTHKNSDARRSAIIRITDPSVLSEIAETEIDWLVRKTAEDRYKELAKK